MGGRSALREKREGKSPAQVPYGAAGSQLEKENGGNAPAEVPVPGFVVKRQQSFFELKGNTRFTLDSLRPTPLSFPADNSSGWRLPGRWR